MYYNYFHNYMHEILMIMMRLQATMPAARYGPSAASLMKWVCPMDLLALTCCLVTVAAARKAIETWAAQRQFGGVGKGRFEVVNVHVLSAG